MRQGRGCDRCHGRVTPSVTGQAVDLAAVSGSRDGVTAATAFPYVCGHARACVHPLCHTVTSVTEIERDKDIKGLREVRAVTAQAAKRNGSVTPSLPPAAKAIEIRELIP